ncbi:MAG TPA: hypothetical protein VGD24_01935 [Gallionella sp.]
MAKFTRIIHTGLVIGVISGLTGCGDNEVVTSAPPPPTPTSFNVGGSVSGLAGSGLVLQLNGANDLTIGADGRFSFPGKLDKGAAYNVSVKSSPITPIRQTCTVNQGTGAIAAAPVSSVAVTCVTNKYAVGGMAAGITKRGLGLELNGVYDAMVVKNGNFVFPDVRLPDGSDYSVAIRTTPAGQECRIKPVNTAPDSDTINIVEVSCAKARRR